MGTIEAYTAARMQTIVDTTVTDGDVTGDHLILTRRDTIQLDGGYVIGPQGPQGIMGITSISVVTSDNRPTGSARFVGLMIYETDTKLIYIWDGSNWLYRGDTIICTSTTHPSSPVVGLAIYETDTNKRLIWNGVRFDLPWNKPWGEVAYAQATAGQTIASGEDLNDLSVTFTAIANRKYRTTLYIPIMTTSGTVGTIVSQIRDETNTQIAKCNLYSSGAALAAVHGLVIVRETDLSGSVTRKAYLSATTSATINYTTGTSAASIFVEDIGPNGAPA